MSRGIGRRIAVWGALGASLALLWATAARAADFTFCPAGSGAGQCKEPQTQAVDFSEGRLYVADRDNSRVNVFKTSDASFLESFPVASPTYLAVDNSGGAADHSVYVISGGKVLRFSPAGTLEKEFGGGFNTVKGIAVDGAGIVNVADSKNEGACPEGVGSTFKKRILKFDHEGTPVETVEPNTAACGQLKAMAVDPAGNIYLVSEGASPELRKYDPSGSELCKESEPVAETRALGFDQAQRLLAAQQELAIKPPAHLPLTEYDTSCQVKRRFAYAKITIRPIGITAQSALTGAFISEGSVGRFIERGPEGPIVVPGRAVAGPVKSVWAAVSGEINPEGKTTEYRTDFVDKQTCEEDEAAEGPEHCFDQGIPGEEETLGSTGFKVAAAEEAIAGCKPFSQEALEEGKCLVPETTYRYRLVASNEDGEDSEEGEFTTLDPFELESIFSSAVGIEAATLNATVNPLGAPATAHFEYVTEGACEEDEAAEGPEHCFDRAEEAGELDFGSSEEPQSRNATIGGLEPATTYRYRVVVDNPLIAEPRVGKEERTFTTFPVPEAIPPCPNDGFRTGPGALLPDCRAHEMVTPVDKGGADVVTLGPWVANQAALSGERLTYGSYRPFGDAKSAPLTSQYLGERTEAGWQSEGMAPPQGRSIYGFIVFDLDFRAYTADICEAWLTLLGEPEPPLGEGASPGHLNLFRRTDGRCSEDGETHYEALSPGEPEKLKVGKIEPGGHSADGQISAFVTKDTLSGTTAPAQPVTCTPEAPIQCRSRTYAKAAGGPLRYACILPEGGGPSDRSCAAGFGADWIPFGPARTSNAAGALSADGSHLYWTASDGGITFEEGQIYLRLNPSAGGAECTTPARPCTLDVSKDGEEESGTTQSRYLIAAKDGSAAYYATGTDLYRYEEEAEESTLLAGGFAAYLGAAEDLSSLYFVSRSDLTPGQKNSAGDEAEATKANLYRYQAGEGGGFSFVARLAEADLVASPLAAAAIRPFRRSSRISPDGTHAAFTSEASLTGYDNTDQTSQLPCEPGEGEGLCDLEVYRYDAGANEGAGELLCVSCNPSGARPAGENIASEVEGTPRWAAAWIKGWETNLYASRALSEDGSRIFFESSDALVARDTNGQVDVYQWEEPGAGGCEEEDPSFSPEAGGCIELISSGQSARESNFLEASPTGDDVFFATLSSLYPGDPGLVDVYDARVGGGFAPPPPPPSLCEGESCQSPPPAPEAPGIASSTFVGPGNLAAPKKKAKRCPKGKRKVKRKGKVRCIKRKRSKRAQKRVHQNHSRRP